MPLVQKFLKHFSTKISSPFKLKGGCSNGDGSSWRRLFVRSLTSGGSASRKILGRTESGSAAPQIKTLNMTRASFELEDTEMPKIPINVRDTEVIVAKALSPLLQDQDPAKRQDECKAVYDVEKAMPASR